MLLDLGIRTNNLMPQEILNARAAHRRRRAGA
jgi:hypothetical protein